MSRCWRAALLVACCVVSCWAMSIQEMFEKAGSLVEEAGKGPDESIDQYETPAMYAMRKRNLDEVTTLLRQITKAVPSIVQPWLGLGEVMARQRKWKAANAAFKEAVKLDKTYAMVSGGLLGEAQKFAKLVPAAIKTLRYATSKYDPKVHTKNQAASVFYNLGLCYEHQATEKEARAMGNGNKTMAAEVAKMRAGALRAYRSSTELKPTYWQSAANLGIQMSQLDVSNRTQMGMAEQILRQASKLNPRQGISTSRLITVLKILKKPSEAVAVMNEAIRAGTYNQIDQYPNVLHPTNVQAAPWPDLAQPVYSNIKNLISHLESASAKIRAEVLANADGLMLPSMEGLHTGVSSGWEALRLDCKSKAHITLFPNTCAVLDQKQATQDQMATVNTAQILRLKPGAHIEPHCGPDNKRLVVHLGLVVPKCAADSPPCVYLTCGNRSETWTEGKCMFFDDSFEHEVWHRGQPGDDRIVLAMQVANPGLTEVSNQNLARAHLQGDL